MCEVKVSLAVIALLTGIVFGEINSMSFDTLTGVFSVICHLVPSRCVKIFFKVKERLRGKVCVLVDGQK